MPQFTINVNEIDHQVTADDDTPLIFVLRNQLNLIGTRSGCGLEQCGSCRVLVDGNLEFACSTTISNCQSTAIETIESDDRILASLKQSFLELNAGQCGFCLSGILMSSFHLLRENPSPDRQQIQSALKDHLCRCGAHNRIINAVIKASVT